MLKIDRVANEEGFILKLSGRIEASDLPELESTLAREKEVIVLDLEEVNLAGRDAILLLARIEANGIKLQGCPAYIREWIDREQD
jgi:anti-anti-sigma regulatory factor